MSTSGFAGYIMKRLSINARLYIYMAILPVDHRRSDKLSLTIDSYPIPVDIQGKKQFPLRIIQFRSSNCPQAQRTSMSSLCFPSLCMTFLFDCCSFNSIIGGHVYRSTSSKEITRTSAMQVKPTNATENKIILVECVAEQTVHVHRSPAAQTC